MYLNTWCGHRFYIGCDQCQDWFHGSCVGIAEKDASNIESYVCPRCKQQNSPDQITNQKVLSDRNYKELQKILKELKVSLAH